LKAFTIFCAPAGLTAAENVEHPTGFANEQLAAFVV
jgi:hypothetical protein